MKLDKIKGSISTSSFTETIELISFNTGCSRNLSQPTGSQQNRGKAVAEVDMVRVSKMWDGVSSAKLFQSIAKGDMEINATISFTNADSPPQTYLEIELTNVALASYRISGAGGSSMDVPAEDMTLSFTAIQWTPYTIGSDKKPKKGDIVKHDLTTGTVS